jgi:hypothetical protein
VDCKAVYHTSQAEAKLQSCSFDADLTQQLIINLMKEGFGCGGPNLSQYAQMGACNVLQGLHDSC